MDGTEDVEISRGTHIPLIGREAENGDGKLLLMPGLDAQRRPADGSFCNRINTVLQRVRLTGGIVAAGENNRLNGPIQLRDGDLKGHLHRMQPEITLLPFLGGLEHQRQGHHVGAVELFQ